MGKAKGKKSGSGAAAAGAAKKCTCDDPFKCICGNRPERPSKGHKWYPEEQIWAGKGHKQKGASGQTATVGKEAQITTKGKTSVAQWQRLPSQLLHEYCQKQKRLPPKYKNIESATSMYKYRVIVKDPKDNDKDLFFVPAKPVPNEEQAKEESALLALLQLTPNLPHERKLPEPYKTTWLNAIQSQKKKNAVKKDDAKNSKKAVSDTPTVASSNQSLASSNNSSVGGGGGAVASSNLTMGKSFVSIADQRQQKEEKRRAKLAKIRKHEAIRIANKPHPVHMSAFIRKQIECLLRGDYVPNLEEEEVSDDEDDDPTGDDEAIKDSIIQRLHNEGFTKQQARTAFKELQTNQKFQSANHDDENIWDDFYEVCLQWLLIHLDEDQLPEGFNPQEGTLDVIAAPNKNKAKSDNADDKVECKDFAARHGISPREALLIKRRATKESKNELDILWNTAQIAAGVEINISQAVPDDELKERFSEEMDTLRAIFDTGCKEEVSDERLTCVRIELGGDGCNDLVLEVVVENGIYPNKPPKRVIISGTKWPANTGAAVHFELARLVSTLEPGEPMIFLIHTEAQELVQSKSLAEVSLLPHLGEITESVTKLPNISKSQAGESTTVKPKVSKVNIQQRRPRERKRSFWTVSSKDTPPAVQSPKISPIIERSRNSLPAMRARSDFLMAVKESEKTNRVVLVTGETGSGKSTQLPAYLLENDPTGVKIVVTQPRRLAATGVASRVAEERGENRPGVGSIGYVVRGDSAVCDQSRLVFCTTGVLLRQMQNENALDCITHIVIDEVHERSMDSDVLLALLKQSLPSNPHLHVILMSATLDKDRFINYWGASKPPHVHIPGRTFPVKDYTLEYVLEFTGYVPPKKKKKNQKQNNYSQYGKKSAFNDSEFSDEEEDNGDNVSESQTSENTLLNSFSKHNIPMNELLSRINESMVDFELLARLVRSIIANKDPADDGSILVFLAGAPEINNAMQTIKRGTRDLRVNILPLHGGLHPQEQSLVFRRPDKGFTKIVLSTNVAETSVTIPDCTVVIDTAREKQASYDPTNRMPLLVEQFASKASLKQRRGRAGRVREGTCYKLISESTYTSLKDHSEPEIRRVALDQTLLQLLFLGVETGQGIFLNTLLDPPSQEAVDAACLSLRKLGAVREGYGERQLELTPLGSHLAGIPAPPIVGKLLIFGSILGCRDAALAMAAGISLGRSPFLRIENSRVRQADADDNTKQDRIIEERQDLSKKVGNSDHALLAAVFLRWRSAKDGSSGRKRVCDSLGLSFTGMRDMLQLYDQLDSALNSIGFKSTPESNKNCHSWRIIHSCAVASMAPGQLVRVKRPASKYHETAEGAREKEGEAREHSLFIRTEKCTSDHTRPNEERVFIHPASISFSSGNYSCPFLVFNSLVRTSKPFLRDVTECSAYSLLLFGGELNVKASTGIIEIDGWIELSANARIGSLIGGLRRRIDDLLAEKVKNPLLDMNVSDEMKLIVKLLVTDGLGK